LTSIQASPAASVDISPGTAGGAALTSASAFFSASDVTDHAQKMVLGSTTATDLGVSVGDSVTVGKVPFTVVGILNTVGGQGFQNGDDLAVVPITAAQDVLTGGSPNSVQRILLSATGSGTVGSAYQEADQLLMVTHGITSAAGADFTIQAQSSFLSTAQSVTTTLTILLASVAAISLLVGGIGVMNIMLVSVTERIAEIGLRKALGARRSDILRQFLLEAAVISAVGGLLGVGLGGASTFALDRFTSLVTVFSPPVAAIGLMIAAGIGLVFGVLPALRAARLEPIVALRGS